MPLSCFQTSLDGNETTSVLSLNASREHNHKHLICRVTNPEMDNTVMEDAWRITVKCAASNCRQSGPLAFVSSYCSPVG